MIYLRFYPYQWLLSLSVSVFGFSEFSLRLPGVLIGSAFIPLTYYITRRITDGTVALIVAMGIAFSFAEVEMARTARMYAPFFFLYLLTAYSIYRSVYLDRERLLAPAAVLLSVASISLHQLGYSLAIFFILAIALNPSGRRVAAMLIQAGVIAASFLIFKKVQEHFFYRARDLAENSVNDAVQQSDSGLFAALLNQVSIPDFSLVLQIFDASFVYALGGFLIVAALLGWSWQSTARSGGVLRLFGLAAVIFAAAQQFNLSLIMLAIAVTGSRTGLQAIRDRGWLACAGATAILFVVWVATALIVARNGAGTIPLADEGTRKVLRSLVDYPNFRLFWSFVLERPLLAVPLALGTLWSIDKIARNPTDPAALFLAGGFWGVLFTNGVLETKFEFFRYNLHLEPFYLILTTIGLVRLPEISRSLSINRIALPNNHDTQRIFVLIATSLIFIGVRPDLAFFTSDRSYYEESSLHKFLGMDRYQDFKTPGEYVSEHALPHDRILVFDPREYWNYIGRVDYWIYSDNYQSQTFVSDGRRYDLYLGIPLLATLSEIRTVITQQDEGTTWILYSRQRLADTPWVDDAIKQFVSSLDSSVVYTGRDRDTVVIALRPSERASLPDDD